MSILFYKMDVNIPKSLHTSWSLWEHQRNTHNNYDKNTCCIGSFSTIQDFWRYYNNYPCPTKIFYTGTNKPKVKNPDREIASLSLFRQGIEPKWEHLENSKGGEFALRNFNNIEDIDKMWEILSVYCIGELFEHSSQITGIRVVDSSIPTNKRVLHRIEIWFKSLQYKDQIEKNFRKLLNIEPFVQVHFKEHSTAVESFAPTKPNETMCEVRQLAADQRWQSQNSRPLAKPTYRNKPEMIPTVRSTDAKGKVRKSVIRK